MNPLLVTHIGLACLTFLTAIVAVKTLSARSKYAFRSVGIFSLISGLMLTVDTPITIAVCAKLGIYLLVIAVTEYHLHSRQLV